MINKSPMKVKKKDKVFGNLDQRLIDNPPMKNRNGVMITECVFIGDYQLS
jgi:hypothetical protein